MQTHDYHLDRDERVMPRSQRATTWTSGKMTVSVMTREQAGVDANEPWVASCDTHGEMLSCATRASAIEAARYRDWCSGCNNTRER
jgi:hypothetical protein